MYWVFFTNPWHLKETQEKPNNNHNLTTAAVHFLLKNVLLVQLIKQKKKWFKNIFFAI